MSKKNMSKKLDETVEDIEVKDWASELCPDKDVVVKEHKVEHKQEHKVEHKVEHIYSKSYKTFDQVLSNADEIEHLEKKPAENLTTTELIKILMLRGRKSRDIGLSWKTFELYKEFQTDEAPKPMNKYEAKYCPPRRGGYNRNNANRA